jgi:hypothetical protein
MSINISIELNSEDKGPGINIRESKTSVVLTTDV